MKHLREGLIDIERYQILFNRYLNYGRFMKKASLIELRTRIENEIKRRIKIKKIEKVNVKRKSLV